MKAIIWDSETLGATFHEEEIPADLQGKSKRIPREADREGRRNGRRRDGSVPERQRAGHCDAQKCIRKGTIASNSIP
jgi:elongation factor G